MKAHIAIVPIPESGHCNPLLGLIAELRRRGHRVSFVAPEPFAGRARREGADVVPCRSGLSAGVHPHVDDPAEDLQRMPLLLLTETMRVLPQLVDAFTDDPPDLVLFDVTAWAGWMLAARLGVPSVQVWPVFASNPEFSLDSSYTLFDFDHPAMAEFAETVERFLPGQGFPDMTVDEFFNHDAARHLVLLPREYQFAADAFDDRYWFVGPCLPDPVRHREWHPPRDGRAVALVSLGTSYNNRPDFFANCARAFAELPWHVVMTVGDRVRIADLGPVPDNVEVAAYLPHLDLLPSVSVYVSPAGISGVLEALSFGVPQVLVPQSLEQRATADRTAELGAGVQLPADCTGAQVRDAVLTVAGDPAYATRAGRLRDAIRRAGGARTAADHLESYLADVAGA